MSSNSGRSDASVKERVREHWSGRAPEYDDRPHHAIHTDEQRRAWHGLLDRKAGSEPLDVLDIGCGTGFLSLLLAELGHRVTGIDISSEMLVRAQQKATDANLSIEFRLGDAERLADPDDSYDLIVQRHVIWTLPSPAGAVAEWTRVLRPGGRLLLIEGHWGGDSLKAEYEAIHDRLPFYGGVPAGQLSAFLKGEGLRDVTVEPLTDETLWGEPAQRERYLITARAG